MSLTAKETATDFECIPEGVYTAVCYSVVDVGVQYSEKFDKATHKIVLTWEIPELRIDVEREGRKVNLPRAISKRYTLSLGDKAVLRKDLETWHGRAFTADELRGFDLRKVLGAAGQLQVIHTKRDARTYANVGALMALPKGVKAPQPENELLFFSFEEAGEKPTIPAGVPEWMAKLIQESREWEQLKLKDRSRPAEPAPAMATTGSSSDDDVPF